MARRRGIGDDYVHSMVDDHSRLAHSGILPDENGATCAGFLAQAAAYFAAHGIVSNERIMNDNAFACRHSHAAFAVLDARHKFVQPRCLCQNGKVERFNRALEVE